MPGLCELRFSDVARPLRRLVRASSYRVTADFLPPERLGQVKETQVSQPSFGRRGGDVHVPPNLQYCTDY